MAANPIFVGTPKVWPALLSTANGNRDGTGIVVDIMTAPAAGGRIENVRIHALGATTAGMIRLYADDGSTAYLIAEVAVTAVAAPGAAQPVWSTVLYFSDLAIPSGWKLRGSTHNAESFRVVAFGGEF